MDDRTAQIRHRLSYLAPDDEYRRTIENARGLEITDRPFLMNAPADVRYLLAENERLKQRALPENYQWAMCDGVLEVTLKDLAIKNA